MNQHKHVFISYVHENREIAAHLQEALHDAGLETWLDDQLGPGSEWRQEITQKIQSSLCFLSLQSTNSVLKRSYFNRELRYAFEVQDSLPEGFRFIIPVRVEPCESSFARLNDFNWIDLFPDWATGVAKVIEGVKEIKLQYETPRNMEISQDNSEHSRMFRDFIMRSVSDFERFDHFTDQSGRNIATPIIEQFSRANLYRPFIDLSGNSYFEGKLQQTDSIVDHILATIVRSDFERNIIFLTGEIGSGKTSLCLRLHYQLCKSFLRDDNQFGDVPRFSLYISLAGAGKYSDILEYIYDRCRAYDCQLGSLSVFRRMFFGLPIILLLDGFDEMVANMRETSLADMASRFEPLFRSTIPLIVTSRSHLFTSYEQLKRIFMPFMPKAEKDCEIIEIAPVNDRMIELYLKLKYPKTWKDKLTFINQTFDLPDLVHRPILLKMIGESVEELRPLDGPMGPDGKSAIGPVDLYRTYINRWISGQISRSKLTARDRHFMVQGLAAEMWVRGIDAFELAPLKYAISRLYDDKIIEEKDVDILEHEAAACSFLVRSGEKAYAFAHKSFMEFLIAEMISEEIDRGRYRIVPQKRIDRAISLFLRDMISMDSIDRLYELMKYDAAIARINAQHIYRQMIRFNKIAKKDVPRDILVDLFNKETDILVKAESAVTLAYLDELEVQESFLQHLRVEDPEGLERVIRINIFGYYESTGRIDDAVKTRIISPKYRYARAWYILGLGLLGGSDELQYLKSLVLHEERPAEREFIDWAISRLQNKMVSEAAGS